MMDWSNEERYYRYEYVLDKGIDIAPIVEGVRRCERRLLISTLVESQFERPSHFEVGLDMGTYLIIVADL